MSENLDLVRSIYADWERGNFANANWADPEIEFELADGPEPGSVTGVAEMARSWSHRLGVWEGFHTVPDDYREVDDERVLALYRFSGRGKGSGIDLGPMGMEGACIFHVRNGNVTRLIVYVDRARAFADLGLKE
jgi:ketosteroid isomerase-like protein